MAIITISRGSRSRGKEVAEKVAACLGYSCIAREVLLEASEWYDVPEIRLVHAVHDGPSFWERFSHQKEAYVSYIRAAFLHHARLDNFVYHGLAGQFFVRGVSHALRVRVMASLEDRIRHMVERDGVTEAEAHDSLVRDDEARLKWSRAVYGIDSSDPSLYDMCVHVGKLTVDDAADIICHTATLETFRTTPESQQAVDDLALAAAVRSNLIDLKHDAEVSAARGVVRVTCSEKMVEAESLQRELRDRAGAVAGVRRVEIDMKLL